MGRPFVFDVPDLAGGLNESAAENIADRELSELSNAYVSGQSVFQREGKILHAGVYSEDILSVFRYNPDLIEAEEEFILLGCSGSIARVDGDDIAALQIADGRIYPTLTTRWWFEQYNNEAFACRRGNGGLKRIYGDSVMDGGISPPATPPIVTDGGDGKKTGGVYKVADRYKNSLTGARSNWSPFSQPIMIPDAHKLAISSITASSSQQINAREIGCTRPDEAVIYLVGQISDNTTTTFVDNTLAPDEYGEADVDVKGNQITDFRHGLPPDQAWAVAKHKERLFILNKDGIFYSEPGWMQSFRSSAYLPVQRGTGLFSWEGHGLVITTDKNAQILLGDTPSDWHTEEGNLSREHGCPAGKSLAVGDGTLFWYTGVNIVASSGGAPAILPGIERIRATLDAIPEASKSQVAGETIPSRGWYVLTVPQASGWTLIVYDYKANVFQTFPSGPKTIARMLLNDQQEAVFAAFASDYNLYEYLSGATDDGSAIPMVIQTKSFGWDRGITDKIVRHVSILSNQVTGSLTVKIHHDGALVFTRSGLSLNRKGWKRFTVNTSGTPGALVSARFEYSGTQQLRVDQIQIDGVNLVRRVVPA